MGRPSRIGLRAAAPAPLRHGLLDRACAPGGSSVLHLDQPRARRSAIASSSRGDNGGQVRPWKRTRARWRDRRSRHRVAHSRDPCRQVARGTRTAATPGIASAPACRSRRMRACGRGLRTACCRAASAAPGRCAGKGWAWPRFSRAVEALDGENAPDLLPQAPIATVSTLMRPGPREEASHTASTMPRLSRCSGMEVTGQGRRRTSVAHAHRLARRQQRRHREQHPAVPKPRWARHAGA